MKSKKKICWIRSDRFERIGEFELGFGAERIFPLLCPVLEYEWLPGWKCAMCHSESGIAETDAVFYTREKLGKRVVWTCITYEPDRFVEYLMVGGADAVIRLSISLDERNNGVTIVTWRMLFTLTSNLARIMIAREWSAQNFAKFLEMRRSELDYYLRHGKMKGG